MRIVSGRLLAAAGLLWVLLVAAAPMAPAAVAGLTYAAGARVCHQRADRSFHVGAAQLPVCARCAGIYAGAALVMGAYLAGGWRPAGAARRRTLRACAAAGLGPTAVTVAVEWLGIAAPSNGTRAAAGLLLGAAAARVLMAELHWWPRGAGTPAPTRT